VAWPLLEAEIARLAAEGPVRVVDVGGGSGVLAVPLAQRGCEVTVVDSSPDALATLHRRAAEAGVSDRVRGEQGDVDALADAIGSGASDLLICHSVLEFVDDPAAAIRSFATVLRPGGGLSLLVANRAALVLARAASGHITHALHALADERGRWGETDSLRQRFDLTGITELLSAAGFAVQAAHGVRVFADLVPRALLDREHGTRLDAAAAEALRRLEEAASTAAPFRDIAAQLHVLARRQ
jgi:SAM-dependent methyltransferase